MELSDAVSLPVKRYYPLRLFRRSPKPGAFDIETWVAPFHPWSIVRQDEALVGRTIIGHQRSAVRYDDQPLAALHRSEGGLVIIAKIPIKSYAIEAFSEQKQAMEVWLWNEWRPTRRRFASTCIEHREKTYG